MNAGQIARLGLLTALVAAATLTVRIPMPATEGYLNLGDAIIIAGALLMGPGPGAIAGGVGSSLADLFGGYFHWSIPTLVIKGLEGYAVGFFAHQAWVRRAGVVRLLAVVPGTAAGATIMVCGYFVAEYYLYSLPPALASLPGNVFQGVAGLVVGVAVAGALERAGIKSA